MTMFIDRADAGRKLAVALEKYRDRNALILAIPKGGVQVGYEIAAHLHAEFSIVITRKLPFPDIPESGFGAIAEDGSLFLAEPVESIFPQDVFDVIVQQQRDEILRRIRVLRKGKPLPELRDRTVILVDDGIAVGSTMRASIRICRNQRAKTVVVAAPVSSRTVKNQIAAEVDDIIVLETPPGFRAVADAYRNWYDVSDEETIQILNQAGQPQDPQAKWSS
jgi:predicted phosphoribosyltransferase